MAKAEKIPTNDYLIQLTLSKSEADELFNLLYSHITAGICREISRSLVPICEEYLSPRFIGTGSVYGSCIKYKPGREKE